MKADLILSADWHLREDQPICRLDDYRQAQARAVGFVRGLSIEHDCPVVIAGDVFDHWKVSHEFESWVARSLPKKVVAVWGQHDLQHHSLKNRSKSALNVLKANKRGIVLCKGRSFVLGEDRAWKTRICGYSWNEIPRPRTKRMGQCLVCLLHHMTWWGQKPFPQVENKDKTDHILSSLKGYDLIVTGDNHLPFAVRKGNRLLVNPGSLLQMRADQKNHKPRVYLWFAKTNETKAVFLPIKKGVISREHIDRTEERDERLLTFIRRLSRQGEIGLSFRDNMVKFLQREKPHKRTKQYILEAMEHV